MKGFKFNADLCLTGPLSVDVEECLVCVSS